MTNESKVRFIKLKEKGRIYKDGRLVERI